MKVTIDTNADSHENIKKVIRMLQAIVGEDVMTNSTSALSIPAEIPSQQAESPMMSIFGDASSAPILDISSQQAETKSEGAEYSNDADDAGTEELFADIFGENESEEKDTKKSRSDMIEFY